MTSWITWLGIMVINAITNFFITRHLIKRLEKHIETVENMGKKVVDKVLGDGGNNEN